MQALIKRFFLATLLIIVIPMFLLSGVLALVQNRTLRTALGNANRAQNRETVANIENIIADHSILTASLLHDRALHEISLRYLDADRQVIDPTSLGRELANHLNSVFVYSSNTGAIRLILEDGSAYTFGNSPQIKNELSELPRITEVNPPVPGRVLLSALPENTAQGSGTEFALIGSVLMDKSRTNTYITSIEFCARIPYLENIIRNHSAVPGKALTILTAENKLVFHTGSKELPVVSNQNLPVKILRQSMAVTKTTSNGWRVIIVDNDEEILRILRMSLTLSYTILVILLGLFVYYIVLFYKRLTVPFNHLMESMEILGKLERPKPLYSDGMPELDKLFERFNAMAEKIEELTFEKLEKERQRHSLEISALQLQINPHFMANTLNTIRFMALAAKNEAIHDMIQALTRIVSDSYALNQPGATLESELDNITRYIYIMNVRFHGNIRFENKVPENLMACSVLRMMIQPVVENSILHGFTGHPEIKPVIAISAETTGEYGESLEILVSDNGKGMSVETLNGLFSPRNETGKRDRRFNPIGLINVRDRIRLNYGEQYGLSVTSAPGTGTTVRFSIPYAVERDFI